MLCVSEAGASPLFCACSGFSVCASVFVCVRVRKRAVCVPASAPVAAMLSAPTLLL